MATTEEILALQDEDKEPTTSTNDILRLQEQAEPTLEQKYITPVVNAISPVLEAIKPVGDVLAKPGAIVGRGIVEAEKQPNISDMPGAFYEGAKAEFQRPLSQGISPESSLSNIALKYPEMQKPYLKEDLDRLDKDPIGQAIKQQFPGIYSYLSTLKSGQVIGGLGDIALQSAALNAGSNAARTALSGLERGAEFRSIQNIKNLIESRTSAPGEFKRIADSGQLEEMARLAYKDPTLMSDPKKVLEYLQGPQLETTTARGAEGAFRSSGGKIGQLSQEQKSFVSGISQQRGIENVVDLNQVSAEAKAGLQNSIGRGKDLADVAQGTAEANIENALGIKKINPKIVDDIVDGNPAVKYKYTTASEYIDDLASQNRVSLSEAEDMKRSLNKKITDSVQDRLAGIPYDKASDVALMEGKKALQNHIDDIIRNTIGDSNMKEYLSKERDISNYLNFQDVYSNARARNVDHLGKYVPVGNEQRGMLRTGLNMAQDKYSGVAAKANQYLAQQRPFSSTNYTPENLAVPVLTAKYLANRNLVQNLADYELPRNSEMLLQNKHIALAKIAQQPGVDPAFLQNIQDTLEKHPDKLRSLLPVMVTQFPNLFQADKYNRVDGRIFHPDPMMQEKLKMDAKKDIDSRKDGMTNTERVILMNGLNRDGSLPDTFQ